MKKLLIYFVGIGLIFQSIHPMNYVTSAYQQVAATGHAIKQQAQKVKNSAQQLVQILNCFQNKLGCSAVQLTAMENALFNIKYSLMPFTRLSVGSQVQKPVSFMQSKIDELLSTLKNAGNKFTPEQKAAFISGAKKVAVAAAVLLAAITVAIIGKSIAGTTSSGTKDIEAEFIAAFVRKDIATVRKYFDVVSLQTLYQTLAMIEADKNYPDRSRLLTDVRIAIHNKESFPEVYQQEKLPKSITPDDAFIGYVMQKNVRLVQEWLNQDMPTLQGLEQAEDIITNDAQYPSRNSLLSMLRQKIHSKEIAEDVRAARGQK